jgi:AAA+ ATPase superfamily predicted ATPase
MVGRDKEIQLLQEALRDDASHFVAVYGRRRVGKNAGVSYMY